MILTLNCIMGETSRKVGFGFLATGRKNGDLESNL